ncbi:hypothetical protein GQ53DRAFT_304848 [Thozetella sp. PMI_491]|nr:hypothetical protein GQ53DRAFT_304848 [Thozetella sp. PMI_491]
MHRNRHFLTSLPHHPFPHLRARKRARGCRMPSAFSFIQLRSPTVSYVPPLLRNISACYMRSLDLARGAPYPTPPSLCCGRPRGYRFRSLHRKIGTSGRAARRRSSHTTGAIIQRVDRASSQLSWPFLCGPGCCTLELVPADTTPSGEVEERTARLPLAPYFENAATQSLPRLTGDYYTAHGTEYSGIIRLC